MLSSHYHTSCHRHTPSSRILSFLLLTVLFTLCPSVVVSQKVQPSPGLFADQPLLSLSPNNASVANFTLTFAYATTLPLLLTNATSVSLSVPSIFNSASFPVQLPAVNSAGLRGFLITSSTLSSTCVRADPTQTGQCTVIVVLTAAPQQSLIHYSLYTLYQTTYGSVYTDTVPYKTWKYYVHYIQYSDLAVGFDLSSPAVNGQLTTAMFITAAQQLYSPGFPLLTNGTVDINAAVDQSCVLPLSWPDVPDWYIVGLYGFASTPAASQLQITSDITGFSTTGGFGGYAILSLLSLILAAGFIGLVVVRGCCMYRRWNGGVGGGSATYVVERTRTVNMIDPTMFQTTAGQSGILRTDRAGAVGATEAEIAALPSKVYVSSVDNDGDEEGEDPRCTICLDEYESNISHITTLRCGHAFHTSCVGSWLRQRRHCPLCLQLIDQAHDVKQRRNSTVTEVELIPIRPTVVVPTQHSSGLASRTRTEQDDGTSVSVSVRPPLERYSSAAQEEDADMCAIEIGTPQHIGRPQL